jgi:MYXO-CTERM domain-containing protein
MRKLPFSYAVIPLTLLAAVACTATDGPVSEPVSERSEPIINGYQDSSKDNDAVVLIVDNVGGGYAEMCTGALIAKNIVLTARHCVSNTTEDYVDCQNDVSGDKEPSKLAVYRGWDGFNYLSSGKQIIHDHNSSLCGHDLALIVLQSNDVTNIKDPPLVPLKVRVNHGPEVNELFTAVGYGLTNPSDYNSAGHRYRRDNVRVLGFEYGTGDVDFVGTQSICQGDSGGPAISAQGAVMGVTSRGLDCYGNQNIWARTDRFKFLLDQAATAAGSTYTGEDGTVYDGSGSGGTGGSGGSGGSGGTGGTTETGGSGGTNIGPGISCPDGNCPEGLQCIEAFHGRYCTTACDPAAPVCDPGYNCTELGYCFMNEACTVADDCAAGTVCVNDGATYCAPYCTADGACPNGFSCAEEQGICFKTKVAPFDSSGSDSTCSVSNAGSSSGAGWLMALVGATLLLSRRRRLTAAR